MAARADWSRAVGLCTEAATHATSGSYPIVSSERRVPRAESGPAGCAPTGLLSRSLLRGHARQRHRYRDADEPWPPSCAVLTRCARPGAPTRATKTLARQTLVRTDSTDGSDGRDGRTGESLGGEPSYLHGDPAISCSGQADRRRYTRTNRRKRGNTTAQVRVPMPLAGNGKGKGRTIVRSPFSLILVQNPKPGQCRNAGKFGSGSGTSRNKG